MKKINVIIAFLFLLGCKEAFEDEKFTIAQNNYYGKELKTDGYYYSGKDENTSIVIFYQNGIVFFSGSGRNKEEFEELFNDGYFVNGLKDNPFCWGIFKITTDSIFIESYISLAELKMRVIQESGIIMNDTTFRLTRTFSPYNTVMINEEKIDTYYYFKQFNPKPDSTNNFIK